MPGFTSTTACSTRRASIFIKEREVAPFVVRTHSLLGAVYELNLTRDHGVEILTLPAGVNNLKFSVKI